jgi:hypothetical protein
MYVEAGMYGVVAQQADIWRQEAHIPYTAH